MSIGFVQNLKAQQYNAYQFVEPNIAISYDSNYFKLGERYSNSFYKTEAYDFTLKNDKTSKTRIHIKPETNNGQYITEAMLDSLMQAGTKDFKNVKSKDFSILSYDTAPSKINGFLCMGVILIDKNKKLAISTITCNHISPNDMTTLTYTSRGNSSLKNDYLILTKFLAGFISYSPQQIATHDSLVKAGFEISVTQTQKQHTDTTKSVKSGMTEYHIENYNYEALIKVKSLSVSAYKVKEVRVKLKTLNGYQVFDLSKNGDATITYYDADKGLISGSGEVIVTNLLDKDVAIPFTFSYTNE
ncbi:hypothetical protein [Ferruginibacter sp.]